MLKAAFKLTFLLAVGVTGYAQKSDEPTHNLKPKNYLGFSLIPSLTAKTEISGDKNNYDLHSHPGFGLEFLIQYHINFRKNYSLILGAGYYVFGSTVHYFIPKEMFDPPTDSNRTNHKFGPNGMMIECGKVQAELLWRWHRNKVHNWNLAAGLSLLYSFSDGDAAMWGVIYYPNGQTKQYVTFTQQSANNDKPWINCHLSGGHEWTLKSKNIFQVNVKLNFSPIKPSPGTYHFTTGVPPDLSGTFGTSGSYIGLSMAYIFTEVSFRIKDKNQK